ncbi:M20/M25/M40 family metallo-hydrolase [bacterium]|nr:M20/M25/M40 family metallo-hydrolase [bacterium]
MNLFLPSEESESSGFSNAFFNKAVHLLSEYIKIPTVNPPGNDRLGTRFLQKVLDENGLETRIIETSPGREALISSLPGSDPELKPLVLAGHIDVAPAEEDGWEIPPFSGLVKDGFIWGRGALDMKSMGIMELMAFLAVYHRQVPIKRGVTFLAIPDEENSGELGAKVIAEKHLAELDPALIINEGGYGLRNMMFNGVVFPIVIAEKLSLKVKLTALGAPGHSNQPGKDSAITRLVQGLAAVDKLKYPMEIHPIVKETLKRLAERKSFPESLLLKHPNNPLFRFLLNREFKKDSTLNAMIRNTICMTVLKAGEATNAIPDIAEAYLDLRLLPCTDFRDITRDIKKQVAPFTVSTEVINEPVPGEPTSFTSKAFSIIEEVLLEEVPDALVVPLLDIGGTDSKHFRPCGIPCYDIIPCIIDPEDLKRIHGINERISINNLKFGIRVMYNLICQLCNTDI